MHIYAYLCFPGWVFQATNRKLGSTKVQLDGGLRQDSCSVTWLRWAPHGSAVTWVEWTVPGMYQLDFHDYCFKGLLWLYMIIQLEKTIISTWLLCFFFGCWFVKTLKKKRTHAHIYFSLSHFVSHSWLQLLWRSSVEFIFTWSSTPWNLYASAFLFELNTYIHRHILSKEV